MQYNELFNVNQYDNLNFLSNIEKKKFLKFVKAKIFKNY